MLSVQVWHNVSVSWAPEVFMFERDARVYAFVSMIVFCLSLLPMGARAQGHGGGGGGGGGTHTTPPPSGPINQGTPSNNLNPTFLPNNPAVHAGDEARVEFKTTSVLIQVPVIVADKSGNHVLNLRLDDFQVLENGKEQKITTFEEVIVNKSPLAAVKLRPGEFSNLAAAQGEPPRSITVVALDTVNTPMLDQTYARKELLKYLAQNLDSSQVFGLVIITGNGLKVVQRLTSDPKELIEALNKVTGELPAMTGVGTDAQAAAVSGNIPRTSTIAALTGDPMSVLHDFVTGSDAHIAGFKQQQAIETTMQAFLGIAWSLSGLPGKKSVIWATGGMPFYLDSPDTVPGGYLSALYERTMATLNESNISIYPVDVRGLVNFMPAADPSRQSMGHPNMTANGAMTQVANRSWLNQSTQQTLEDFAAMTGGKAGYNTNDISGLFKSAVDDSSSYYLLGYYLDTKNTKPGWRQLKVKFRQKDDKEKQVELRSRSGFFVTNATINPDIERKSDIDFAVLSPFDSTGLPLTVRWLGMSADGVNKKVQFGLQLPSNALTLGPQNLLNFDYTALAYSTKDGKKANSVGKTIQGNIPEDRVSQLQLQGLGFKNELELAPGEYTVRFVVRDDVTGRVGSVTAPITVPN
jgi:VWFA-related protein